MKYILSIVLLVIIAVSCNSRPATKPITTVPTEAEIPAPPEPLINEEPETPDPPVTEEDFTALQFNVALGISSQRPRWVLFKNGTYIIFPEGYTDTQIEGKAKEIVSGYANQNITIRKSSLAKGYIGTAPNGIYTYISQEDLGTGITDENKVKAQALQNIIADKNELRVIHINSKKN